MAKSEKQKLKILYVAKFFLENSDENHEISANDIIDYLQEECGIEAERRSIYRDIALLRDEFGMDIENPIGGRYKLVSRQFEYDDLLLLAECVHAAKFISAPKAKELVQTISELCSIYQAESLQQEVFLCDRVKTTQKGTLNIISTIRTAMSKTLDGMHHYPQKISFNYMTYSISNVHEQIERHQGKLYIVSPYKLLINDGNYYLLAYEDESQEMRTYRIDRMKNVNLVDSRIDGRHLFRKINLENYTQRVFSMYKGELCHVSIRFTNNLLDAVIDRFGTGANVSYRADGSNHFIVSTDIEVSNQFFGWLLGFGVCAKIISPSGVIDTFKSYIHEIGVLYFE